jgi:phosphoadenosine phosphosulfate reductase
METRHIEAEYHGTGEAQDILKWALDEFHPDIALACSFSAEDIVLAHMMLSIRQDARVFAIDTGRLNEETYECAEMLRRQLGLKIEWYFPERPGVEKLERNEGLFSFRDSLDARHACCHLRKVEPLGRALSGLRAWVTGLRSQQSVTRSELKAIDRDDSHGGIVKVNPLVEWRSDDVWKYIRQHGLPYNRLHDSGYPSIGCAPCTRAIEQGEHPRAGRWWWEAPEHKECGLHTDETEKPTQYNI